MITHHKEELQRNKFKGSLIPKVTKLIQLWINYSGESKEVYSDTGGNQGDWAQRRSGMKVCRSSLAECGLPDHSAYCRLPKLLLFLLASACLHAQHLYLRPLLPSVHAFFTPGSSDCTIPSSLLGTERCLALCCSAQQPLAVCGYATCNKKLIELRNSFPQFSQQHFKYSRVTCGHHIGQSRKRRFSSLRENIACGRQPKHTCGTNKQLYEN